MAWACVLVRVEQGLCCVPHGADAAAAVVHIHADTHLVKDVLEAALSESRALDVLDGTELLCKTLALLGADGTLLLAGKLVEVTLVVAQVDLRSDNEAGDTGAVVVDFGEPLFLDVLKRCGRGYAEADEEDICLGVREGSQTVVVLLSCSVEQSEGVGVLANHDSDGVCICVSASRSGRAWSRARSTIMPAASG